LAKDEIAFVLSDIPNGKAIARTFLVDENDKYTLNQRVAGIKPFINVDAKFLSYLMNRNKYFLSYDDGSSQTNLSKSEVENFYAKFPNKSEQNKIANLFSNLDNLIRKTDEKNKLLKKLKKSLLNNMFL